MPTLEMPAPTRRLPEASDIENAAVTEPDARRVHKIIEHIKQLRPVWWRRDAFHAERFRDTEPKWHILAARTRGTEPETRWNFTWTALCGRQNTRSEILYGMFRFGVTKPKAALRCRKCTATHADLLAAQARAAADERERSHVRE